MADQKTYGAKQVASRIGTDAKQLRKFFRDPNSGYDGVGQGGRYDFPEEEITKIKAAFDAWSSTKTTRNRSAQSKPATPTIPGQRTASPTPQRQRVDPKLGLHGNGLDDDDLRTRMLGIGERARRHNLIAGKNGKLIPGPRPESAKEHPPIEDIINPYPPIDSIPGLAKALEVPDDLEDLDSEGYDGPSNELQPLVDYLERSLDDGPEEPLDEFDIEDL